MSAVKFKLVKSISDLPNFDPTIPIFCDIESDGLYINTRLVQYYQPQTSEYVYILDVNYFGNHTGSKLYAMYKRLNRTQKFVKWEDLKEFHSKLWLVWWNGSYDQGTLRFGSREVDDLWYLAKMQLNLLDSFNLDVVTDYLFPNENFYGDLDKKKLQKAKFKQGKLSEEQLLYAATDVYVMAKMWPILSRSRDIWSYKIDKENLAYTVRWQQIGLKVSQSDRLELENEYKAMELELSNQLPDVNVNSPKQVKELLGVDSSNEETLLRLAGEGCPYSANILKLRSTKKSLKFLDTYNRDRIYGFFNPYGARTGRWTCKGGDREDAVNLQQLPRKLRKSFAYDEDSDRIFIGGDLPTAELRLAAAIYVDETMIHAFKNNIDIHKVTAAKDQNISIEDVTSSMRKDAKASNFGLLYGMKEQGFVSYAFKKYDIIYTLEEAKERRDSWMDTYSGIASAIKRVTKEFYNTRNFTVRTPGGRVVKPGLYTDALNIPVQGAVSEITKLWIHYIYNLHHTNITGNIMRADCGVPIANTKHDDVTLDIPKSELEYWNELMSQAGKDAWTQYCKLPDIKVKDIPMDIEITHGRYYNDAC